MLAKFAAAIEAAGTDWSLDLDTRSNYRGRGMRAREESTAGVVGDMGDIVQAIALAAADLGRLGNDDDIEEFAAAIGRLRWDELGQQMIAY